MIIISHGHDQHVPALLKSLRRQILKDDRIVIVDNHPHGKLEDVVVQSKVVTVLRTPNEGFSAAANIAAELILSDVDIIFLLGPTSQPSSDLLDVIRRVDYAQYAAVMPLVLLPDGKKVNTAGNIVHMSGLSWCGGYLDKPALHKESRPVNALSGAAMAISTEWWRATKGLNDIYFMYYEDTDLSSRILLRGGKLGLVPQASVRREYDFKKGPHKWVYIERNRMILILETWPWPIILLLLPLLFAVEIGLWLIAIIQGRLKSKVKATLLLITALPKTLLERRRIQSLRKVSSYDFFKTIDYKINTPTLGALSNNKFIDGFFHAYYLVCAGLLRIFAR